MFLAGKRILIMGLLSNRSIAYGVARACRAQGAELAFTYQNERFRDRITEMAAEFGSDIVLPCDVAEEAERTLGRPRRGRACHCLRASRGYQR
jgi:enoyl-[acyl-carrier protein] reductase I